MRQRIKVAGDENKELYNGKELVDNHNLFWYHYGVRYYDPQLGRWHVLDPADEFHSPYVYVGNNPLNYTDPTGMFTTPYVDEKGNNLIKTNDGNDEVMVIRDIHLEQFENDIKNLYKEGLLDDLNSNMELWRYGYKLSEMKLSLRHTHEYPNGNFSYDSQYPLGYGDGYSLWSWDGELSWLWETIIKNGIAETDEMLGRGWNRGFSNGREDFNSGRMNMFNPILKNNEPLINLIPVFKNPVTRHY
jgi:RHS repeat-associated protein